MSKALSRRALFGRLRGGPPPVRPPWSLPEDQFLAACTRCGACATACPAGIVTSGPDGVPTVSFATSGCTFCGKCADACEVACFGSDRRPQSAWNLSARIAPGCVETKGIACRMCDDACDARAIRFRAVGGGRCLATVDAGACTGCGLCVSVCPVHAITIGERAEVEITS